MGKQSRRKRLIVKHNPAQTPADLPVRRPGKFILVALTALVLVTILFLTSSKPVRKSESVPQRSVPTAESSADETKVAMKKLLEDRPRLIHLLKNVTAGDQEGTMLAAFLEDEGRFTRLLANHQTIEMAGNTTFKVVIASRPDRIRAGITRRSLLDNQFIFDADERALIIPELGEFTDLWGGVVATHELRHAYDLIRNIERPHSTGDEFHQGEVRAYELEIRLLDRYAKGAFTKETRAVQESHRGEDGDPYKHEDRPRLDAFFPPAVGVDEGAVRSGLYLTAVYFAGIDPKSKDVARQKRRIVAMLYERLAAK